MVVSFLVNVFTNKRDAILSGKLTAQEVRDEYISIIEKHPFIVSLAGKSLGQEFFS